MSIRKFLTRKYGGLRIAKGRAVCWARKCGRFVGGGTPRRTGTRWCQAFGRNALDGTADRFTAGRVGVLETRVYFACRSEWIDRLLNNLRFRGRWEEATLSAEGRKTSSCPDMPPWVQCEEVDPLSAKSDVNGNSAVDPQSAAVWI